MFNLLDGQVTRTPPKTLASTSLCPYLGKWNQHRYEKNQQQEQQQKRKANLTLCFSDLELNALSFEFFRSSFPCATIPQASCRSLARLESAEGTHTIYDVIRHVPEMSCHSRLQS